MPKATTILATVHGADDTAPLLTYLLLGGSQTRHEWRKTVRIGCFSAHHRHVSVEYDPRTGPGATSQGCTAQTAPKSRHLCCKGRSKPARPPTRSRCPSRRSSYRQPERAARRAAQSCSSWTRRACTTMRVPPSGELVRRADPSRARPPVTMS